MSKRPWYQWFPGDYMHDTAHLSIEEDCLYRRLLDIHWRDGQIPSEPESIRRLARFPLDCFDRAWPEVRGFFIVPGGRRKRLVNKRMQSLQADCSYKIQQKRDAANARWNKELHADAIQTQCDPDPDPDPDIKKKKPPSGVKKRAAPTGTRLPPDWTPQPTLIAWAETKFPKVDFKLEQEKFQDYWQGTPGQKGRKANWDATWRNWIRKAAEQQHGGNGKPYTRRQTFDEMQAEADKRRGISEEDRDGRIIEGNFRRVDEWDA